MFRCRVTWLRMLFDRKVVDHLMANCQWRGVRHVGGQSSICSSVHLYRLQRRTTKTRIKRKNKTKMRQFKHLHTSRIVKPCLMLISNHPLCENSLVTTSCFFEQQAVHASTTFKGCPLSRWLTSLGSNTYSRSAICSMSGQPWHELFRSHKQQAMHASLPDSVLSQRLTSLGSNTYSRSRVVEKQQRRVSPGLLLLMSTL